MSRGTASCSTRAVNGIIETSLVATSTRLILPSPVKTTARESGVKA